MSTTVLALKNARVIILDVLLLSIIYLVPTMSHLIGFPLYLLDPMRLAVLGSLLIINDKKNSIVLAITLPLFSYCIASHPILYKNIIIAIELTANVILIDWFSNKWNNTFLYVLFSIIISKLLYYSMKAAIISVGILKASVIDTSVWIQIIVSIIIAFAFTLTYPKRNEI